MRFFRMRKVCVKMGKMLVGWMKLNVDAIIDGNQGKSVLVAFYEMLKGLSL